MNSDAQHFDLVVIGTGPGGEGAAMRAAKGGKTGRRGRTLFASRRRLHALGHDPQQGPAAGDLSHEPVQPERRSIKRMDVATKFSFPELLATANR